MDKYRKFDGVKYEMHRIFKSRAAAEETTKSLKRRGISYRLTNWHDGWKLWIKWK